MSEWRQPYLLSNLDLVTASFTLIAEQQRAVALHLIDRCTPVVVSSETPMSPSAIGPKSFSPLDTMLSSSAKMTRYSRNPRSRSGHETGALELEPLCTAAWRHRRHPRSSSPRRGRPAQHLLGAPPVLFERLALPARPGPLGILGRTVRSDDDRGGGVVLVEKMLQLTHRPRREGDECFDQYAVWIVMWSDPAMRDP